MEKKDIDITKEGINRPKSNSSDEDLPRYAPPSYEQTTSTSKAISTSPVPNLIPGNTKVLTVFARGISSCGVGAASRELEVPIFEGTDTSVEPLYISTRAKRSSGNAILSHRQRGDLYASNYKFGPFRDPVIRHAQSSSLGSDVKRPGETAEEGEVAASVKTHSFSNKIDLTIETGQTFTWRYGKTPLSEGKKKRVMVLEATTGKGSKDQARPLAVLVRTKETRTSGTSKWDGGNGGQLVIAAEAGSYLDEGLIVAGCLMMLKYEIDRQRGAQTAAIGAAASS
jgi:hypothetical protein